MSDWWANKLGTAQPRTTNLPPMPPSQQPMTMAPPAPQYQPNLPPSSAQASVCPECRSKNYGSFEGAKARCYDCGYPIRQSGSGLGKGISVPMEGPTQAAVQIQTGGWNPTTIIGKLG
jgi:hypothetical protein